MIYELKERHVCAKITFNKTYRMSCAELCSVLCLLSKNAFFWSKLMMVGSRKDLWAKWWLLRLNKWIINTQLFRPSFPLSISLMSSPFKNKTQPDKLQQKATKVNNFFWFVMKSVPWFYIKLVFVRFQGKEGNIAHFICIARRNEGQSLI